MTLTLMEKLEETRKAQLSYDAAFYALELALAQELNQFPLSRRQRARLYSEMDAMPSYRMPIPEDLSRLLEELRRVG